MKCPCCHSEKTKVRSTQTYQTCVIRLRECLACMTVFRTVEEFQQDDVLPFSRRGKYQTPGDDENANLEKEN